MFQIFIPLFIPFTLPFSEYFWIFVHSCICSITVLWNNEFYFTPLIHISSSADNHISTSLQPSQSPCTLCALVLFTSITIRNIVSFALSLNLLLNSHISSDTHSSIRDCVYSTSLTSRRPKNLCLTLSEPLRLTLFNSEDFTLVLCCVLHFADTSTALQAYQHII